MSLEVVEGTSPRLIGTVRDGAGIAKPGAQLTTLTVTLYNQETGLVINGRQDFDIKPFVDGAGVLTWDMDIADQPIMDDSKVSEVHVALVKCTYPTNKGFKQEVRFTVRNLAQVP